MKRILLTAALAVIVSAGSATAAHVTPNGAGGYYTPKGQVIPNGAGGYYVSDECLTSKGDKGGVFPSW